MNKKVKAIKNFENLCFKCLQKKPINTYSLYRSEYGSSFDNYYTYLQICDDCKPEEIDKWFNEESETIDEYCADYKYEKNIIEFIETIPLEGQELFWNRCAYGASAHNMGNQDWIDWKLGIMLDEKYKEYSMYSPSEIKAYKEKFPICQHPVNIIYGENSKGCRCPFGGFGEYGQECDEGNIWDACYKCKHFIERITPIRDISDKDYNDYVIYYGAKTNEEKYKSKFELE